MIYTFHIGLPKTATTFLQVNILNNLDDLFYLRHRNDSDIELDVTQPLIQYCHSRNRTEDKLEDIVRKFRKIENSVSVTEVLISNENISITPNGFWEGGISRGPEQIIERLTRLRKALGNPTFRVILGTRDPVTWLASRYAESAKDDKSFSQADFDTRIDDLCSGKTRPNVTYWLQYDLVEKMLTNAFGNKNVLLLPMENLDQDPTAEVQKLGLFLGRDLDQLIRKLNASGELSKRKNVLREGDEFRWRIKGGDGEILLSFKQQEKIRNLFT